MTGITSIRNLKLVCASGVALFVAATPFIESINGIGSLRSKIGENGIHIVSLLNTIGTLVETQTALKHEIETYKGKYYAIEQELIILKVRYDNIVERLAAVQLTLDIRDIKTKDKENSLILPELPTKK